MDVQAFGNVATHAQQLHGRAALHHDRRRSLEPAFPPPIGGRNTVFQSTGLPALECLVDGGERADGIGRR